MSWLETSDAVNSAVIFQQSVVDGDASYFAFHVEHCLRVSKSRSKTSGLQEAKTFVEKVYVDGETAGINGGDLSAVEVGDWILTLNKDVAAPVAAGTTLNQEEFDALKEDYKIKQIRLIQEMQDFDGTLPVTVFEV